MSKLIKNIIAKRTADHTHNIPLQTTGKLYTSPMPYSCYDTGHRVIKNYLDKNIDMVFSLVTDKEVKEKSRHDLFKQYKKNKIQYTRYVIKDFQAPTIDFCNEVSKDAEKRLTRGENIAIHCYLGIGRTALVVCCILIRVSKMSADEAVSYVKETLKANLTTEQVYIIHEYEKQI
ncbi:MAG: dual specificity protein phosphatase family protein [Spirochaetales bacterium]|nr:dual specificity protein phosphatase family protein [Spirochaetales bacterium]